MNSHHSASDSSMIVKEKKLNSYHSARDSIMMVKERK